MLRNRAGRAAAARIALLRVADHADDLEGVPFGLEMPTDGHVVLVETRREGVVDDGNERSARAVVRPDATARADRDVQGLEEARRHPVLVRAVVVVGLVDRRPVDSLNAVVQQPCVRHPEGRGGALHPGQRANARDRVVEQPRDGGRVVIARILHRDARRNQIRLDEPRREIAEMHEGPNQQACTDQQNHAERDLADHEDPAGPAAGGAGDAAGAGFDERGLHVEP
jgi:hypothetical protein